MEIFAKDPSGEFRAPETQELVEEIRDRMAGMSLRERHLVRESITDGFCKHCSGDELPCHCDNEE